MSPYPFIYLFITPFITSAPDGCAIPLYEPADKEAQATRSRAMRNLERAGDHATHIAEQVVYMVEGQSVRHRCQG